LYSRTLLGIVICQITADERDHLTEISRDPLNENPKLNFIKELILKYCREDKDSCGIVFVKTREMTVALMNWMKETEDLRELNPHNLVGSNAPSQKAGLSAMVYLCLGYCSAVQFLLVDKPCADISIIAETPALHKVPLDL